MSHDVNIWVVQVRLNVVVPDHPELGIYSVMEDLSELRVTEAPLAGPVLPYAPGFLRKGWRPELRIRPETRIGGVCVRDAITIPLQNANQFSLRCDELKVSFPGRTLKIFELIGDEVNSTATDIRLLFSGVIEQIDGWDEQEIRITAQPPSRRRRTNLSLQIGPQNYPTANKNAGKILPLTYGRLDRARFLRTSGQDELFRPVNGLVGNPIGPVTMVAEGDALEYDTFFVIFTGPGAPPAYYWIQFTTLNNPDRDGVVEWRNAGLPFFEELALPYFVGKYLRVVSGDASRGATRRIAQASVFDHVNNYIKIVLETPFPDALVVETSRVQIVTIEHEYTGDSWPLKGFYDEAGVPTTKNHRVFTFDKETDTYSLLARDVLSASASADNRVITINPEIRSSDLDKVIAYTILPLRAPRLNLDPAFGSFWIVTPGLYSDGGGTPSVSATGSLDDMIDRNHATLYSATISYPSGSDNNKVMFSAEFKPPVLPDGFRFNKCYIGISMYAEGLKQAKLRIGARYITFAPDYFYDKSFGGTEAYAISLPGTYFTPTYGDNADFYVKRDNTEGGAFGLRLTTGYELFEISGVSDLESYRQATRFVLQVISGRQLSASSVRVDIHDIAVIFTGTEQSIESEIFMSPGGRIRNANWRAGKVSADLLQTPQDLIEHVVRLQDFGGTTNPGQEYDPLAVVDAAAFDHASMAATGSSDIEVMRQGDLRLARQIEDEAIASSDGVIRSLCEDAHVVSHQRADGYERIVSLTSLGAAVETITLGKEFEIGPIVPPQMRDIYCTPTVKYNYDPGSKRYLGEYSSLLGRYYGDLRIHSAADPEFDPKYVDGFENEDDARTIYLLCNGLYRKYGHIEPMPTSLMERRWIARYIDAAWWLYHFLILQDRPRTYLALPYDIARLWTYGTVINLQLPHQTADQVVRARVEGIAHRKPRTRVDLVIVDSIPTNFYDRATHQQVTGVGPVAADRDWQATGETYADRGGTGQPDRQTTGEE